MYAWNTEKENQSVKLAAIFRLVRIIITCVEQRQSKEHAYTGHLHTSKQGLC